MQAIIETGGKQYRVAEGDVVFVEKLPLDADSAVVFDKVLAVIDENGSSFGAPYVDGAKVEGKVIKSGKDKKIIVFKFRAKKNYRRKSGHRQPYTKVQIDKIALS
ncbi:MAG: 50S ribosomal protein L21 [Oscillospiraceae bacterium]|jgi:large subunit ribosomal protein L21